jgi:hypothetical protein
MIKDLEKKPCGVVYSSGAPEPPPPPPPPSMFYTITNIVESGIKHHKPNKTYNCQKCFVSMQLRDIVLGRNRAIYRLGIFSLAHALVHVTDFPVVNVHADELSSARIWQHTFCATLSANVNINYRLPIKVSRDKIY